MRRIYSIPIAIAAALVIPASCHADQITYTMFFVGSGQVGSANFTNEAFSLAFTGETSTLHLDSAGDETIDIDNATFSILGGPSGTIEETPLTVRTNGDVVWLANSVVLLVEAVYPDYNLQTAVDPLPVFGGIQVGYFYMPTSDGELVINSVVGESGESGIQNTNGVFEATVTPDSPVPTAPEPSSLTLIGTGLLGMFGVLRRRLV